VPEAEFQHLHGEALMDLLQEQKPPFP